MSNIVIAEVTLDSYFFSKNYIYLNYNKIHTVEPFGRGVREE